MEELKKDEGATAVMEPEVRPVAKPAVKERTGKVHVRKPDGTYGWVPAVEADAYILQEADRIKAKMGDVSGQTVFPRNHVGPESHNTTPQQPPIMVMPMDMAAAQRMFQNTAKEQGGEIDPGLEWKDEMDFLNDPVTVVIGDSMGHYEFKDPAQYCSINGKCLVMLNGRWASVKSLPRRQRVTLQRKAVQMLLRSRIMTYEANIRRDNDGEPENYTRPSISDAVNITVVEDKSPRASEWWAKITGDKRR